MSIVAVNIKAELNIFSHKYVHLIKMHMGNGPKQFEDDKGNLWFKEELSNFKHLNFIKS